MGVKIIESGDTGKVKWGIATKMAWPQHEGKRCRVCGVPLPIKTEEPKKRRALVINLLQLSGVDMVSIWLQMMT
jgi:hypothetical protein